MERFGDEQIQIAFTRWRITADEASLDEARRKRVLRSPRLGFANIREIAKNDRADSRLIRHGERTRIDWRIPVDLDRCGALGGLALGAAALSYAPLASSEHTE